MKRLGDVEFTYASDPDRANGNVSVPDADARARFLAAVSELAPKCPTELAMLLRPWRGAGRPSFGAYQGLGRKDPNVKRRAVWIGLEEWVARWRLGAAWIHECAVSTMFYWDQDKAARTNLYWASAVIDLPAEADPFTFRGWEPAWEGWEAYREALEEKLSAYEAARRADMISIGLTLAPRDKLADHHFKWLVRYQLLGEDLNAIAGRRGHATVSEAVRATASLVGLTLRAPSKGGRPPKI